MGQDDIREMMEKKYTHGVNKSISQRLQSIGVVRDEAEVGIKVKALKTKFYEVSLK